MADVALKGKIARARETSRLHKFYRSDRTLHRITFASAIFVMLMFAGILVALSIAIILETFIVNWKFVGGAAGAHKTNGQHIDLPAKTTVCNLHLTLLNKAGVDVKSFADSTGAIAGV